MSFRSSSARQVEQLVSSLGSARSVERDSAVARLIVIGERAVERLLPIVADPRQHAAAKGALAALEALADPRALDTVLAALLRDEVAVAAVQAAAGYLGGDQGARVLDVLTTMALDERRPEPVRIAALHAVRTLGRRTVGPLMKRLEKDANAAVRAAARAKAPADRPPAEVLQEAADSGLGDDPAALRAAIASAGDAVPLGSLQRVIDRMREREDAEPAAKRASWKAARGAAHAALARRDSRIALYDLRESLESAVEPLPADFLTALSTIGDPSCLEAIAAAYSRSRDVPDSWRRHLAEAFRQVAARHGITRRHAVMKRIAKRYGAPPQ